MALVSADGIHRWVGRAYGELVGRDPEELVGRRLVDVLGPNGAVGAQPSSDAVVRRHRVARPGGWTRWIQSTTTYVPASMRADGFYVVQLAEISTFGRTWAELTLVERRLALLAEVTRDATIYQYRIAPSLACTYMGPGVLGLTGYSPDEFVANPDLLFALPRPEDAWLLDQVRRDPGGITGPMVMGWRHRDGRIVWVRHRHMPVTSSTGEVVGFEGLVYDVSAQRAAEEERRSWWTRFLVLVQHAMDLLVILRDGGQIAYVNQAAARILGCEPGALVARDMSELIHPDDVAAFSSLLRDARRGEAVGPVEVRARHQTGEWRWLEVHVTDLRDEQHVAGIVLSARDASSHHALVASLRHQALNDPLTGLPNRAFFTTFLDQALHRLERHRATLALLFIDLDGFKQINDQMGHQAGDEVLVTVAERLRTQLRSEDTAARLGGDEFVVCCEDLHAEHEAVEVAERIAAALSEPMLLGPGTLTAVTASVGVAVARSSQHLADQLLDAADRAMYQAKSSGAGRVTVAASGELVGARTAQLDELREALDDEQLFLLYQPIILLDDSHVLAVEAFLRWEHPRHGVLRPAVFLPLAEETGMMPAVDAWVIDVVCRDAARWRRIHPGINININLSSHELVAGRLAQTITAALSRHDTDPAILRLEFGEAVVHGSGGRIVAELRHLADLGVGVTLDNYGMSDSGLRSLPEGVVREVKLDASLVAGSTGSAHSRAVIDAATHLWHGLGATVVAEGVETRSQLEVLRTLQVDAVQGYHIAAPADGDEVGRLLARLTAR